MKKESNEISVLKHLENGPIRMLIIAGCTIEYTPVVKSYIRYAQENNCKVDTVEYKNFKRVHFIVNAFWKIITNKYSRIICVNNQSLPNLFFLSWLSSKRLIFWKLESGKLLENWSVAHNIQILEFILNRKSVALILPTTLRAKIQVPKFHFTYILPNAPIKTYITKADSLRELNSENIKLILYGTINENNNVFLNEWINFCERSPYCELTIIGKNGLNSKRVNWRGKLKHDLLIDELSDHKKFNFSLVGYRPTSLNNKYAAPNKLIESLACGLPVIGHVENPYVVDLINQYECGLVADFGKLDTFVIDISHEQYTKLVKGANNAASRLCLSSAVLTTPLRCN